MVVLSVAPEAVAEMQAMEVMGGTGETVIQQAVVIRPSLMAEAAAVVAATAA